MNTSQCTADAVSAQEPSPLATGNRRRTAYPKSSPSAGNLRLRDLWVDLQEFHLCEIDLDVASGEYFVLLGPTGAGKTVLLETIAGLHQPHQGHVLVDGENITNTPPERRGIGFVYQDYALFPHLNVADNIAFGLRLDGLRSADSPLDALRRLLGPLGYRTKLDEQIQHRIENISHLLSIDHLLHRSPRTLSGGEQQRVALARALMVKPRLLLLDEPLSALDPETREGLQRELARIHGELGTTTLHVTHDFEEAVALGDRIAVVHEGRIVQVGTPEDIFRRPANAFVARFVGVRNIFAGHVVADAEEEGYKTFKSSDLKLAVITDLRGAAHASIRPEEIIIAEGPVRSSARNCFEGHIVDITDRGTLIYVTVRVPPNVTCVITRPSLEEMMLQEDKEVHIAFKASAVHVF